MFEELSSFSDEHLDRLRADFDAQGYAPVRAFLPNPLPAVACRYLMLKHETQESAADVGTDELLYADLLMETILDLALPAMEQITDRKLWPTYSYYRIYKKGDDLKPHRDRPECEISATMCLGDDLKEIRRSSPEYAWPIFMNGTPLVCAPGDMVVYKGCEVKHWREPFEGEHQMQVFLHYVDQQSPDSRLLRFDQRAGLGMPQAERLSKQALRKVPESHREAIVELRRQAQKSRSS